MTFDRETLEATKQAIEKWKRICYKGGVDADCALCNKFGYNMNKAGVEGCFGCPIYEFTGTDCMGLKVYTEWKAYYYKKHKYQVEVFPCVFDHESQRLAQRMLDFLKEIYIKTLLLWNLREDWTMTKREDRNGNS